MTRTGEGMDIWEVYDQYSQKVRKFILAIVRDEWAADDLTQETFLKIQINLQGLKEPSKISPWLFQIAHNLCLDYFRKRKTEVWDDEGLLKALEQPASENVLAKMEQCRMSSCVQDQMDLLPDPFRMVLVLYDLMEFSHQEIAQILDISVQNVKVRLHRARKKFKDILEEKCNFEKDDRNILVCIPVQCDSIKREGLK